MPDTIPPSVPEELHSEIREELWRAHTLLRSGKASLIDCLEIVYDAYAKYALTKPLELTRDVLTKEIPEWMAKWVLFLRWPLLPHHQSDKIRDDMLGWSVPPAGASVPGGMTFGVGNERRTVQLIKSRIFPRIGYWLTRLPQAPAVAPENPGGPNVAGVPATETEGNQDSSAPPDLIAQRANPGNAVVAPTKLPRRYPNRATWLRARLDERGWTPRDLQEAGGPEHRTTTGKILEGEAVQRRVLKSLARGLSEHKDFPPVRRQDIPNE
jgi:hypothetical protein